MKCQIKNNRLEELSEIDTSQVSGGTYEEGNNDLPDWTGSYRDGEWYFIPDPKNKKTRPRD